VEIDRVETSWGRQRCVNLVAAWHGQLLEVLGAMGMRTCAGSGEKRAEPSSGKTSKKRPSPKSSEKRPRGAARGPACYGGQK